MNVAWVPQVTMPPVPISEFTLGPPTASIETAPPLSYPCPLMCPLVPHRCWFVTMGLDMAAHLRSWWSFPVYHDDRTADVLEALYESQAPELTLQEVVAASLRRIRESLSDINDRAEASSVIIAQPELLDSAVAEPPVQTDTDVGTESQKEQSGDRRHHDIIPLMSIRCRRPRPRRGLLGPGPGTVAWAHEYCRALLRQSRR